MIESYRQSPDEAAFYLQAYNDAQELVKYVHDGEELRGRVDRDFRGILTHGEDGIVLRYISEKPQSKSVYLGDVIAEETRDYSTPDLTFKIHEGVTMVEHLDPDGRHIASRVQVNFLPAVIEFIRTVIRNHPS